MGRNVGDDKLALEVELVEPQHEDGGEEVVQQEGRMPRFTCTQPDTMDSRYYKTTMLVRDSVPDVDPPYHMFLGL